MPIMVFLKQRQVSDSNLMTQSCQSKFFVFIVLVYVCKLTKNEFCLYCQSVNLSNKMKNDFNFFKTIFNLQKIVSVKNSSYTIFYFHDFFV